MKELSPQKPTPAVSKPNTSPISNYHTQLAIKTKFPGNNVPVLKRNPCIDSWTTEVFIPRSPNDSFSQEMEYVHYNPIAAGLYTYPKEYKYSSAKFYESGIAEFGFIKHWMA